MAYFTEEELKPLRTGIRTFIRLTGFIHDDFQYRWFADESDAISSLKSIVRAFQKTEPMLGKSKYQGQLFDAVRQVREDLAASLLTGMTENITVANRKRYGPLYYLIVLPAVNLFSKFDHQTILNIVEECVSDFVVMFEQCDSYGTLDDALVAQAITRNIIQQNETAIKAEKAARKKATRKKKKDDIEIDLPEVEIDIKDEVEVDEEEVA